MADEISSEAIVLRRSNSGENDRRLTLLTAEHGKLSVIAKGARKPGSRLAGSSDTLVYAKYSWAAGKFRRFVTQVQPLSSFPGIRANYDHLIAALAFVEIVDLTLPYESPQPSSAETYSLVLQTLESLDSGCSWMSASLFGQVRLLEAEGALPNWTNCAICSESLAENPAWVSCSAGGYLCQEHFSAATDRFQATAESLITLKKLAALDSPPKSIKGAEDCLRVLFTFWRYIVDSPLPANLQMIQGIPVSD